jgi:hypothetical protein
MAIVKKLSVLFKGRKKLTISLLLPGRKKVIDDGPAKLQDALQQWLTKRVPQEFGPGATCVLLDSTGDSEISLENLAADIVSDQEQGVADEVLKYGPLQDAELQLKAEVKGGTGMSSQLLQHI